MAVTINNFIGWETGGLEETDLLVGTTIVGSSSPTPQFGSFRLGIIQNSPPATSQVFIDAIQPGTTDAGNDYVMGAYLQFPDIVPALTDLRFMGVRDTANLISLKINTSGDVDLVDDSNTVVGTATAPFTANTWHLVELYFQKLSSGNAEVFVDGVSIISVTGEDFAGAFPIEDVFFACGVSTPGEDLFVDGFYFLSGAVSPVDRLSTFEVVGPYQNTAEDATDVGDTLDVGTWANVSETPVNDTNDAQYTQDNTAQEGGTTTDEGTRSGPSGDSRISSAIEAAKYIYKIKHSKKGPDYSIRFGNDVDGMTDALITTSSAFKIFERVSQSSTIIPTGTEFFQQGFKKSDKGKGNIVCSEIWSLALQSTGGSGEKGFGRMIQLHGFFGPKSGNVQ